MKKNLLTLDVALSKEIKYMLKEEHYLPSATSIVNYIEFIGYDENGNLVEYTESYSRPDKLEVRFVTNDI